MNRERNYRKNPHTARFLQTFHSGISSTGRNYREEMGVEDRSAMEFVSGGQVKTEVSRMTEARFIHIRGYKIRLGDGLISEKQAKRVVDIAETKANVTDAMVKSLSERLEQGFAKQAASEFITRYKDWPRKSNDEAMLEAVAPGFPGTAEEYCKVARPVRDAQGVQPGRYAIREDGVVKFFRVTEGKGRWAGRTFVEAQASDDHHAIRNPQRRAEILAAIAENPLEAELLYGRELGRCSRCGRTLTKESSRAYGMGDDCRSKL